MAGAKPVTIDSYLKALPERSRESMIEIRKRLREAAPDAVEGLKYGMPTAALNGKNIIYYAAWKRHIGIYPIYRGGTDFEEAIAPYRDKKDTVRFELNEPLPEEIIDLILKARLAMLAQCRAEMQE